MVRELPGVVRVSSFIGESAPMMYYNVLTNEDNNPAFLHLIVDTVSLEATNQQVPGLQQSLDKRFPQAQSVVRKYEQGSRPGASGPDAPASPGNPRTRRDAA